LRSQPPGIEMTLAGFDGCDRRTSNQYTADGLTGQLPVIR
jgi:hypothetical protein